MKNLFVSSSIILLVAACGESAEPDPGVDASSTVARVNATVRYSGNAQGSLVLAAFPSMPPMGPPAGFAQMATPTFPAALAIENLPSGSAYVLALLDVAPSSPQMPGPEDRTAWSNQLTLAIGETTMVELTLSDP